MREEHLQQEFDVPARALWESSFFDENYLLSMYEALRLTIVERNVEHEGEWPQLKVTQTLHVDPDRDVPKALLKIVRGATRIVEDARFDAANRRLEVSIRVPVVSRLVDFGYVYQWTEAGQRTLLQWRGYCHARIPLLSRKAEDFLLGDLVQTTRDAAVFMAEWFADSAR